jgi:dihydroorotate dehydrogenase
MEILSSLIKERETKTTRKPILLKISPDLNFNQIDEVLDIINEVKLDGLVATNTTTGRYNLTVSLDKVASIGNGGMSGQPLREKSTEIIKYISVKTQGKLPIIGVGGILSIDDALEKLNAGASLVQLYSGFIYEGPVLVKKINKALIE